MDQDAMGVTHEGLQGPMAVSDCPEVCVSAMPLWPPHVGLDRICVCRPLNEWNGVSCVSLPNPVSQVHVRQFDVPHDCLQKHTQMETYQDRQTDRLTD